MFLVLAHRSDEFRAFFAYHDALMEKENGLSKGEREMIVVVVKSKNYDMNQEIAARCLGAPRWKAFLTITLPQIRFAVITAALLSFLTSFDEVVFTMFISGGDNPTLTRNRFNALRDQIDPTIAAISPIMILVTSLMMILAQLFGRSSKGKKHSEN